MLAPAVCFVSFFSPFPLILPSVSVRSPPRAVLLPPAPLLRLEPPPRALVPPDLEVGGADRHEPDRRRKVHPNAPALRVVLCHRTRSAVEVGATPQPARPHLGAA